MSQRKSNVLLFSALSVSAGRNLPFAREHQYLPKIALSLTHRHPLRMVHVARQGPSWTGSKRTLLSRSDRTFLLRFNTRHRAPPTALARQLATRCAVHGLGFAEGLSEDFVRSLAIRSSNLSAQLAWRIPS